MRIEVEPIKLGNIDLEQVRMTGQVMGLKTKSVYILKTHQYEVMTLMAKAATLEGIIFSFLNKDILLSFIDLKDLVVFLVQEDLIRNSGWLSYFQQTQQAQAKEDETLFDKIRSFFGEDEMPTHEIQEELRKIPFMRSLQKDVLEIMLSQMRVVHAPAGVSICQEGQVQRSLFVLLKGQASILKKEGLKNPKKLAILTEGSVFGEVGFFLGEPRTAEVVTDKASTVVRLKYQPEIFDKLIEQETARNLQKRFWVIHALMKSKTFSAIPDDCFDALVFAGEIRTFPADTLIFKQGDLAQSTFLIIQGGVVVVKDQANLRVLGQGDSFGEVALMINSGVRSATVKTQKETTVLEIRSENFYRLLSRNLVLGSEFEKIAVGYLRGDFAKAI